MKILYSAIDQVVPGTRGGSVHVTAVAEGLAALGHEVHVLVTPGGGPWPSSAVHWIPMSPPLGMNQLRWARSGAVAAIAARLRPDVIMERYYNFGGVAIRHARRLGARAVLEVNAPVIDHPGSAKAADPPRAAPKRRQKPKSALREPRIVPGLGGPLFRTPPQNISAPLSPSGYVFPVYGDASFSDTWGAPRATTGRHQGTDIFALLGAPILAVADGTLFSVGWNRIGGWRLWLRDRQGNQFYYAHLAAYSPITRNGAEVKAGQVVGFNGNSGDAQGTPFHVHFEIHPVGLLPLGYEGGAVNPIGYLSAWRRLEDVSFAVGRGWAPPVPASATAPKPAALLLGSTDISSASGLEPGSLDRALSAPVSAGADGS